MALDLSQFTTQQVVLEVRYEGAFLLWDRAGTIWSDLRGKFPAAKPRSAQPNQQQVLLEKNLEGAVHFDRAVLMAMFPGRDLDKFRASWGPATDLRRA